jgi:hypothetical protein
MYSPLLGNGADNQPMGLTADDGSSDDATSADDEEDIGDEPMWYPAPERGFEDFEGFVAGTFEQLAPELEDLRVELHERIVGVDGEYDFDATVRFSVGGLAFLVLVEAKCHRHPIRRDVVQVLLSKVASVGAQKGVLVSTAPFQKGAMVYAATHGIALIKVTEGRFTIQSRSASSTLGGTVAQARDWGIPDLVGHCYVALGNGRISVATITGQPDYAKSLLLPPPNGSPP